MPIYSDDLKIKKSAVMADVPEGGGAMTGTDVLDGVSNQVFNDISDDNRANGAFHLRKLFGIAHTDDVDTLLGAGWTVLKPPADSNVDVTCFETPGWFDERTDALDLVESYLVKGPRLLCRVQDTHYEGTDVLQLYNVGAATSFPASGDSIVMRNPDGTEQRVRALRVTITRDVVVYDDAGAYTVNLASCDLNTPLRFDLLGKPPQRTTPSSTTTATVFTTVAAAGAKFHGVKPLASPVVLGPSAIREVTVAGGIFAQLVPASTQDTPVVDLYPLVQRPTLSRTATAPVSIATAGVALTADTTLTLPTAIEPATLAMTHGAVSFTSNASGQLLQGATVVGTIDWSGRTLTMAGSSPNYGTATNTITYKPATITGATVHSLATEITEGNQSSGFVQVLQPPPAPGTYSRSTMVQGTWYQITDDGSGKVSGADNSYGIATLTYSTGSVSGSGPVPDVGSVVIETWGEAASARAATGFPTRVKAWLPLATLPEPGTLSLEWPSASGTQTATVDAAGVVTGPAQVGVPERLDGGGYRVLFSPDLLPTGPVDINYTSSAENAAFTNDGGGSYTLTAAPVLPGSVRFNLVGVVGDAAKVYPCHSVGTTIYTGATVIGTINNTTGEILLNGAASISETTYTTEKVNP